MREWQQTEYAICNTAENYVGSRSDGSSSSRQNRNSRKTRANLLRLLAVVLNFMSHVFNVKFSINQWAS